MLSVKVDLAEDLSAFHHVLAVCEAFLCKARLK